MINLSFATALGFVVNDEGDWTVYGGGGGGGAGSGVAPGLTSGRGIDPQPDRYAC